MSASAVEEVLVLLRRAKVQVQEVLVLLRRAKVQFQEVLLWCNVHECNCGALSSSWSFVVLWALLPSSLSLTSSQLLWNLSWLV